jgi:hypothetical protein
MNLRLTKNTIVGNAMGTPVSGMTRSAFGGASPVAGLYSISPPVSDPIFGMYAVLTPVAGPSPAGGAQAAVRHRVGAADYYTIKGRIAPLQASKVESQPGGSMAWSGDVVKQVRASKMEVVAQQTSATGPLYVLSDRPIPGRNCIIVSRGFADVMSALKAAGGGQITIA